MYKTRKEMLAHPKSIKIMIEEFINSLDCSDATRISYGGMLNRYSDYLKKKNIVKPIEADLVQYKKYLANNGCHGATVQKYTVILRQFYKWTEQCDYYPNIGSGLKGGKVEPTFKREPLSIEEVRKLLKFAKERKDKNIQCLRDYVIVSLIVKTGLRTIEVSRANVDDLVTLNGINYLCITGKGHDDPDEKVKLPDSVYALIQEYLSKRNSKCRSLFVNAGPRCNDGTMKPYSVSIAVKHLLRCIGIDDKRYTAHSLRHTCATIALLNGAKFEEVQMVLRHKSIETTTIYAHAIKRETNNVEFIVDDAIEKDDTK